MTARADSADPSGPRAPGAGPAEPDAAAAARRRAAAFVDLWERQLSHAAAQGPLPARRPQPGADDPQRRGGG